MSNLARRIARRIVGLFSILIIAGSFAGDALASPQGKRIALLTTPNAQPFIGAWTATFMKSAEAMGMKTTNFVSPFDAALQSQQIDDAIAQKFNVILLITINHQAILPALTRAKAAGVPVILINNPGDPGYSDLFVSYVGSDQEKLGRLAGENLVKGLAEEGKTTAQVAAVTGTASQLNTVLRMIGFKAALAQHAGIKLVVEADAKWNTALSEKITGELLVRFAERGGLDAIYGMADNQATGIIQAIESAGLKAGVANKGIVVVASNCMKDGIIHIRDGSQYATNTQIPVEEAEVAAARVADFFNGKPLKKREIVESYAITQANVDKFAQACSY